MLWFLHYYSVCFVLCLVGEQIKKKNQTTKPNKKSSSCSIVSIVVARLVLWIILFFFLQLLFLCVFFISHLLQVKTTSSKFCQSTITILPYYALDKLRLFLHNTDLILLHFITTIKYSLVYELLVLSQVVQIVIVIL